jgi:hypothetical protein
MKNRVYMCKNSSALKLKRNFRDFSANIFAKTKNFSTFFEEMKNLTIFDSEW